MIITLEVPSIIIVCVLFIPASKLGWCSYTHSLLYTPGEGNFRSKRMPLNSLSDKLREMVCDWKKNTTSYDMQLIVVVTLQYADEISIKKSLSGLELDNSTQKAWS